MPNFKVRDCLNGTRTGFFSEMQYGAESYSCQWDTKTIPDGDFDDNRHVYLQVLDKFDIPVTFPDGVPTLGRLEGMDINRMSAIEAIKLSLAQNLLNGEWWEVVEDGLGGVIIKLVYKEGVAPSTIIALDPRMCIPTTSKKSNIDIVVVTGYDPPPCRYAGTFNTVIPSGPGVLNPPLTVPNGVYTTDFASMFSNSCHGRQLQNHTIKTYLDPMIDSADTAFGSQTENPFFDATAFEQITAWVIKIEGMDEDNASAAKVNYSFNNSSTWLHKLENGLSFLRVTESNAENFACGDFNPALTFYQADFNISNQNFTDKYGDQWPLLIKPTSILYFGYKITSIVNHPQGLVTAAGVGPRITTIWVEPVVELIRMNQGSDWVYTLDEDEGFNFSVTYQPKNPDVWVDIAGSFEGPSQVKIDDQSGAYSTTDSPSPSTFFNTPVVIGGSAGLGYLATGVYVEFAIDRPSVTVETRDGTPAKPYSDSLHVSYAPIVIKNNPPQKAYKTSSGETVQLTLDDLALSQADTDPTTCQNLEETAEGILQDKMQGNVVNVTFPFCATSVECAQAASTLLDYQNYGNVATYALTCGPEDDPILGAAVEGYDSNLRIESISYSYNDGSSYTIEVALQPVYSNAGSWGQGNFGGEYETVSREAMVVWAGGDGVNYRVRIKGLGEYTAINTQEFVFRVGERVNVTLFNVPKVVV